MLRICCALLSCVTALFIAPGLASAAGAAYPDADWSEAWIPSSDGVTLHADVLRPKGATATTKTPVVISIGPYFNHSGQTGPAGPRTRSTTRSARTPVHPTGSRTSLKARGC
jgi:predicted acyl esterase